MLGIAGFVLSLVNWYRLRPDVFIPACHRSWSEQGEDQVLHNVTIEVCNGGDSGVTVAALFVLPGHFGPQPPVHHRAPAMDTSFWLSGPELPCRLDAADTKTWTIDASNLNRFYPETDTAQWRISVSWYARRRLLPWAFTWQKSWRPLRLIPRSPYQRSVRVADTTFSSDPSSKDEAGIWSVGISSLGEDSDANANQTS